MACALSLHPLSTWNPYSVAERINFYSLSIAISSSAKSEGETNSSIPIIGYGHFKRFQFNSGSVCLVRQRNAWLPGPGTCGWSWQRIDWNQFANGMRFNPTWPLGYLRCAEDKISQSIPITVGRQTNLKAPDRQCKTQAASPRHLHCLQLARRMRKASFEGFPSNVCPKFVEAGPFKSHRVSVGRTQWFDMQIVDDIVILADQKKTLLGGFSPKEMIKHQPGQSCQVDMQKKNQNNTIQNIEMIYPARSQFPAGQYVPRTCFHLCAIYVQQLSLWTHPQRFTMVYPFSGTLAHQTAKVCRSCSMLTSSHISLTGLVVEDSSYVHPNLIKGELLIIGIHGCVLFWLYTIHGG